MQFNSNTKANPTNLGFSSPRKEKSWITTHSKTPRHHSQTHRVQRNHFYSLSFGQAEASIYQPTSHFNQPHGKSFLMSRIDFTVLLSFRFLKKHHLPVGQVKNRIHQPDSKIHQPRAIRHYFLCTLNTAPQIVQTFSHIAYC